MNDTGYVRQVLNCYEEDYINSELGQIRHNNIDMFNRQEKIADILQLGYNFYVYDYGVYNYADFNKTSFLEKNVKIFVVGSKPNELDKISMNSLSASTKAKTIGIPTPDWNIEL